MSNNLTSRQNVIKTLAFNNPNRIPRHLWYLPWAEQNYPEELKKIRQDFPDDIVFSPGYHNQKVITSGDPYTVGEYVDEWGCVFNNMHKGIIGEVKHPLISDWQDVSKIRIPTELLSIDIEKVNEFCQNTDKFVIAGCCPRPFERIQFLRGTENIMMDLAMETPGIMDLIQEVHSFFLNEMNLWAKTQVDSLIFMDDWGSQTSLLISPVMWRKIFKPLYKDYIDIAHQNGKKCFMHSDGFIIDIIPDLIELGLDAINCQIFCMGVENLGKKFKGKITFWGEIDRQNLLPNASIAEIEKAVELVYKSLYENGGLIAQLEFGPGAKPENVYQAFNSFNKGYLEK